MTTGLAGESTLMKELIRAVVKDPTVAREVVGATLVDQTANYAKKSLDELGLAPDDNEPPAAPSGVTVVALMRALAVNWPIAPPAERVLTTHVRLTNTISGTVSVHKEPHQNAGTAIFQLNEGVAPHQHLVEVAHEDAYGRLGAFTAPITATPGTSTVDELSADRITAGLIDAIVGITSGGRIEALGTNDVGERVGVGMYPTGLELIGTSRYLTAPSVDRGSKITNSGTPFVELYYFAVSGVGRGTHLRSDGNGAGLPGINRLEATYNGDPSQPNTARAILQAGATQGTADTFFAVAPHLEVGRNSAGAGGSLRANGGISGETVAADKTMQFRDGLNQAGAPFSVNSAGGVLAERFVAQYRPQPVDLAAGGSNSYAHGLGGVPTFWQVSFSTPNGWRDIGNHPNLFADARDLSILITNNTASLQTFRIRAYR